MKKSYFVQSFLIVLLATGLFLGLKKILPKRLFPENTKLTHVVVDSLMLEAVSETATTPHQTSHPIVELDDDNPIIVADFLDDFFQKLQELESHPDRKIRIAYFGDSMTDGDYIVQTLRSQFQNDFGGEGVGFVPIVSESAPSRGTIKHSYSPNWKNQSFLTIKNPLKPFGISGQVAFTKDSINPTWVEYKASTNPHLTELIHPTLYYGQSHNNNAFVELEINSDTTKVVRKLHPTARVNRLVLAEKNLKSIRINFKHADSIPFYGLNSTLSSGVYVDNFSTRGNSGLPLSLLNKSVMQDFDTDFNYDLIVLHFGTNVLNYGNLNYTWYERAMSKVVNHLRECFPRANFLIISTADKATKYEMVMKTDSAVVPLSNAQKKYALGNACGFINLYQLMGGENSMIKWAEEEPVLANKDYTHFNLYGSKKIGQLIYQKIMEEYQSFKSRSK